MERKFYTNNFENLLKENADQFKMYPSKKVWHGIYNGLHPGRRWPSIAMSLFLIFTLVSIDHLNTQQPKVSNLSYVNNKKVTSKSDKFNIIKTSSNQIDKKDKITANKVNSKGSPINAVSAGIKIIALRETNFVPDYKSNSANISSLSETTNKEINKEETLGASNIISTTKKSNALITERSIQDQDLTFNQIPVIKKSDNLLSLKPIIKNSIPLISSNNLKSGQPNNQELYKANIPGNVNQTNNITHFLKRNSSKIKWAYYFTPSLSYRVISKNKSNSYQTSFLYNDVNNYVNQTAAPGFEAGTAFKYLFSKKLKFISGLQLNYSAYTILANNIHPILTTLMLNNNYGTPDVVNGISFFSNSHGSSPVKLHNYSFQASIPIGFEYVISESDYVQFSTVANFQPSYIIADHYYLLSSDKRNYLSQSSLLRNFNMNTSAGLFVTFKSKWMDLQLGPQIRYQLLSTYTKAYPVSEHLINYGIKFGVSKTIK